MTVESAKKSNRHEIQVRQREFATPKEEAEDKAMIAVRMKVAKINKRIMERGAKITRFEDGKRIGGDGPRISMKYYSI